MQLHTWSMMITSKAFFLTSCSHTKCRAMAVILLQEQRTVKSPKIVLGIHAPIVRIDSSSVSSRHLHATAGLLCEAWDEPRAWTCGILQLRI